MLFRSSIGVKLTQKLMDIESEEKMTLFQSLIENEDTMSDFLGADFLPLFVSAYHHSNNQTELVAWLKKMKPNRRLAQSSLGVTQEMKDFLVFVQAEALMSVKRFSESEPLLKQITSKRYREMAIPMQVENYCGQKQFSQAVKFGLPQVQKLNTLPSKKRVLASLVSAINEGKLWKQSDLVLQQARKQGIKNKELAPFLYLAGKSQSEQKVCKKTIAYYSEALTLDSDHLAAQEAKFRLGKCYQKEKKKELAKKQWQAVVDSQDAFWAPLAKSEINLMEGP